MNNNMANMANMSAMGGPVGGGPMPMMNNGALAAQGPRTESKDSSRINLNTYIYDYFLKEGMYDCARALLSNEQQSINVSRDSPGKRRDENGNIIGNGVGDDPMDTDSKEDVDSKRPADLPAPNLPNNSDTSFLYEWFCLFWDILSAQRNKNGVNPQVSQYVAHTQAQNRLRQNQQQEMLRQMRPDLGQFGQNPMMRNMPNGMQMNAKQPNLARTAMANNQNPQAMQAMLQQAKQGNMQRDPSDMDANRNRPSSPGSAENAPSPSKRPRLDGNTPFNPQQPGMMPNGRPQQGMPVQQVGNGPNSAAQAQQMLLANGINPSTLTQQQFQTFQNQPPSAQAKSIQTYSQNLQQHHGQQMPNKPMGQNPGGPPGQGSPMMPGNADPAALGSFYNAQEMGGPGAMRPGPGGTQGAGGSNHALQDYQMQLMLLEQQNKKRLMMARQEQDNMGGIPRGDGPAGPGGQPGPGGPGPNGQPFQDTSPQGARAGTSPNPTDQMKRGTPQMNPAGIPSPLPEGAQSRGSPNPMGFMPGGQMDPNMPQPFFKGMDGNMVAAQMNGAGMRPPSSHPGQPFNGQQMNPNMMRQQGAQGAQGGPQMQWQGGPNGNPMVAQGGPQGPVQGTPQQRAMPPPSAPAAGGPAPAAGRTQTSSPQQAAAAPPTPSQSNKAAPKKKNDKAAKNKTAAQKKSNPNLNAGATPASESAQDAEPPTPATPVTPMNPTAPFAKNGQAGPTMAASAAPPPANPVAPAAQDPSQLGSFDMGNGGAIGEFGMDFAPLGGDNVLQDFDFDSFLHEDGDNGGFDFTSTGFNIEGNEIGAE